MQLPGIHVFSLPRLSKIVSVVGHNSFTPHAISALAADETGGIFFSGDRLGYVKKWGMAVWPKISLEPFSIVRCHEEEISALVLLNRGMFLATCSTDRCVHFWRTDDMRYIGFFGSDHGWNIETETTWSTETVCEPEPEFWISNLREKELRGHPPM
jgi:WD40 repeat protein